MTNTYKRHLEMRKSQKAHIRFLLWIGFVRFGRKSSVCDIKNEELEYRHQEEIIWPFSAPPKFMFKYLVKHGPRFYMFRNHKDFIKWVPGRILPVRWGFGVCGFEFGDRG